MTFLRYAKNKLWRSTESFEEKQEEEEPMLDKLFAAIKDECGIEHFTSLMNAVNQVSAHLKSEYVKSDALRNDAMDALSDVFQSLKKNPS